MVYDVFLYIFIYLLHFYIKIITATITRNNSREDDYLSRKNDPRLICYVNKLRFKMWCTTNSALYCWKRSKLHVYEPAEFRTVGKEVLDIFLGCVTDKHVRQFYLILLIPHIRFFADLSLR